MGSDAKFDLAKQLGAHHVINYRAKDFKVEIEKLFGKESVDVIFDSLGGETFKKGYQLLRPTGVIVGFGAAENAKAGLKIVNGLKLLNGFGIFSPAFLIMKSKGIIGVNMLRVADHKPIDMKRTMDAVVELYDRGELKPVNGGIFPLSKIAEAHDLLESRKSTGKIAIQWDA